jgi:hypothetical protein
VSDLTPRDESDDELHERRAHPDFEYTLTEGPRKRWDDASVPPETDDPTRPWERNTTEADPQAWERFEYTEESYWRRRRTPAQIAARAHAAAEVDRVRRRDAEVAALPARLAEVLGLTGEVGPDALIAEVRRLLAAGWVKTPEPADRPLPKAPFHWRCLDCDEAASFESRDRRAESAFAHQEKAGHSVVVEVRRG